MDAMGGAPAGSQDLAASLGGPGSTLPPLVVAELGEGARHALAVAIRVLQDGDPLAPVRVVVPSTHAAVSLRRSLVLHPPVGTGRAGLANVTFRSFAQVATSIATPRLVVGGRPRLTPIVERAAIRAALERDPGWLNGSGGGGHAERALQGTFAELRKLPDAELAALGRVGHREADVVRLFARTREACAAFVDHHDVLNTAIEAIRQGDTSLDSMGHLVWFLPRRVARLELDLTAALHARRKVTVLLGSASRDGGPDPSLESQLDRFEPVLGPCAQWPPPGTVPGTPSAGSVARRLATGTTVVRAPDPDAEVRSGVSRVLLALQSGVAAERIALVSRVASPYDMILPEQLRAAGVPFHSRSPVRLAQTVAGRSLLGLLDLLSRGASRTDLFSWLRSAPLNWNGSPIPTAEWDLIARAAGIAGGRDQWDERLARASARERAALLVLRNEREDLEVTSPAAAEIDAGIARCTGRVASIDALNSFTTWLLGSGDTALGLSTWRGLAAWARGLLDNLLGDLGDAPPGHPTDAAARRRIEAILDGLGELDQVNDRVDFDRFREVLTLELEHPADGVGVHGRGVFAGLLADLHGCDHDLVIILGMGEGLLPPRAGDDPASDDRSLPSLGGVLSLRRPSYDDEHRDLVAAMVSAPDRVLSYARSDTRAQRGRKPARWLLDEVALLERRSPGSPVSADELDLIDARSDRGWLVTTPSIQTTLPEGAAALTANELVLSRMLESTAGEVSYPAGESALGRGLDAVEARQLGRFGPWTGHVGPDPRLRFDTSREASSTSIEEWATCPFKYLLRKILDVKGLDERAGAESISGLDRGSLTHEVLEALVGDEIAGRAGGSFGWDAREHLREVFELAATRYRDAGRTGRPLLWAIESDRLLRRLLLALDTDESTRNERGVEPVAVELSFGHGTAMPPVTVDLGDGRAVSFRGTADRVDMSADGRHLVVIDYKTGSDEGYAELKPGSEGQADIVCRGRHLQLVVYALAARARWGDVPTDAYFWFLDSGDPSRGGPIGAAEIARFRDVLGVIIGGIEAGNFPARPGAEDFRTGFKNCGYCEFQRLCPPSRADLWERVREAPELASYRQLAEGSLPLPPGPNPTQPGER